jgi:MSHA biogenesis protein MshI
VVFFKKPLKFSKGAVGISLQPDGVSIAHVEQLKNASLSLHYADFFPFQNPGEALDVLKTVVRRHGFPTKNCVAILDAASYQLMQVEPPDIPQKEIPSAVRWQVKDLLNYSVDEAVLDVFLVPKESFRNRNRIAFVVAAPKETVLERVGLLQEAKLGISAMDVPEMVLRNVGSRLPEAKEGMVFLYLQKNNGLILLIRESTVYLVRRINFGTHEIFGLDRQADSNVGDDLEVEGQGNHHLENLVLEIQRSLDFFESSFNLPSINHLIVAPFEEEYPELLSCFGKNLGINVRIMDTAEIFEGNAQLSTSIQARCLTAMGGALREIKGTA